MVIGTEPRTRQNLDFLTRLGSILEEWLSDALEHACKFRIIHNSQVGDMWRAGYEGVYKACVTVVVHALNQG